MENPNANTVGYENNGYNHCCYSRPGDQACNCIAQTNSKVLPEAEVVNEIQTIKEAGLLKLSKPFIVDGDTLFNGWFIVTNKIIFKSGARLSFSRQAQDRRRNFYIVAKEISSEDGNAPGMITYEHPPVGTAAPIAGQAPSGAPGRYDGDSGAAGQPGTKGAQGPKGYSAPSLTITVLSVPTSGPSADFRGGKGGQGGQGQKGGDGGAGAKGSPASQSMFDCKAGGGRGGDGGPGGPGGPAGNGGTGGDGGTVKIIAPAEMLPSLGEKFRVVVSGGQGGDPGAVGSGGIPGPGGPGGQDARPFCGGGSPGSGGAPGPEGSPGQAGPSGTDGDFLVGTITSDLFAQVYK